ncbi:MAG: type II secretion system protein [Rickettsiales bacterium]|nr:type II secretion system protein [Rickettsiales bacterium]
MTRESGFTMIQMAIVLVIVGLIIGGLLSARTLIRNTELDSINMDATQYRAAINLFRQKYGEYPGDFTEAENYWGAATTNNGDGSGTVNTSAEYFLLWQHLSLANMIKGSYTGLAGSGGADDVDIGTNSPTSKVGGARNGFCFYNPGVQTGASLWFADEYSHTIIFGAEANSNELCGRPGITSAEARVIDQKYDDGLPATGAINAFDSSFNSGCATSDNPDWANYATGTQNACGLNFRGGM